MREKSSSFQDCIPALNACIGKAWFTSRENKVHVMALPAFMVRTYPAFRPARLYRVFVSGDSLYFIRLGGLISPSDAGSGYSLDPGKWAVSLLIRKFAKKSLDSELTRIENKDPATIVESRLLPPILGDKLKVKVATR